MKKIHVFEKPFIFITGAPRSGTSMLTKIIDSHPDIAILMENIFGNRRRHWQRTGDWDSDSGLKKAAVSIYSKIKEPVIGNKVVTPDVWDAGDIFRFCTLFREFKIIYIVRDPKATALSRLQREPADFFKVFNKEARKNILLDFRTRFHAYISSWRQSVETYWKLKDGLGNSIKLIYYEDLCRDFETRVKEVFSFLEIIFSDTVLKWFELPHHDENGKLVRDLKYKDSDIFMTDYSEIVVPHDLAKALKGIEWQYDLWKNRRL